MEYSFWSLIAGATLTVKLIMALLTLMSLSSWAIIFGKWISLGSAARKARTGHERFERARDLREAVQSLPRRPEPVRPSWWTMCAAPCHREWGRK